MGTATSTSGGNSGTRSKKVVLAKLETCTKTGVLNISDQGLKSQSSLWSQLSQPLIVQKLKTLDISQNPLKGLPVEIYGLLNLKTLHASNCSVQQTYEMTGLVKLAHLHLDHNDLESNTLAALPLSVTHANFSFNHFQSLPPSLLGAVALIKLDLSCNRIADVSGIEVLINLEELCLDDNLLTELPEEFGSLEKLKILSIQSNQLSVKAVRRVGQSIPAPLLAATALTNLNLRGNINLRRTDVLKFDGCDVFLERLRAVKEKGLAGGASMDSSALFGLD